MATLGSCHKTSVVCFAALGSGISVRSSVRFASKMSLFDVMNCGSTVSLRAVCRVGSSFSVGAAGNGNLAHLSAKFSVYTIDTNSIILHVKLLTLDLRVFFSLHTV